MTSDEFFHVTDDNPVIDDLIEFFGKLKEKNESENLPDITIYGLLTEQINCIYDSLKTAKGMERANE